MDKEKFLEFYHAHRGEVNGASIGFVIASVILLIGFFRTLFIVVCIALGYYIGKRISHDKGYFKNLLDKILPPGTYR